MLSFRGALQTPFPAGAHFALQPPPPPSLRLAVSPTREPNSIVDQLQLHPYGPQLNSWPIGNCNVQLPSGTRTANILLPALFDQPPAFDNYMLRDIGPKPSNDVDHERPMFSTSSVARRMITPPAHSWSSEVEIPTTQPVVSNSLMEQFGEDSAQRLLPLAMQPSNALSVSSTSLRGHMQSDGMEEGWCAPNAVSGGSDCGDMLRPSDFDRVHFMMQEQQSCCGLSTQNVSAQSNTTFFPPDQFRTTSTVYQPLCCIPHVSMPIRRSDLEQSLHAQQQQEQSSILSKGMCDQAHSVAHTGEPSGSKCAQTADGMVYPDAVGSSVNEMMYANTAQLQQMIEELKAQIEHLRARCAALEVRANRNEESDLSQQNDAFSDGGIARWSNHTSDDSFAALTGTPHDPSDRTVVVNGREATKRQKSLALRSATNDEV
ncbi:hypothetical protein Tcan_03443 [Toxocara canis]|uniref:Uncharacterized protein n=1 Tax=Toxocara canis TaxID=6265 RepID=A0A0B2V5F9_TOXCA|nr:hypothetical protein Tcan_03443 [Toxocara canis]